MAKALAGVRWDRAVWGWAVSALALLLPCVAVRTIQVAAWVPYLDTLPWLAVAGFAVGTLMAMSGLPFGLLHIGGAVLGAAVVGALYTGAAPRGDWLDRWEWLGRRVVAWLDAARSGAANSDALLFAVAMALLAWMLGFAGAATLRRYGSPWGAVLGSGVALLVNLSYSTLNLVSYLVVYVVGAAMLLAATDTAARLHEWRRDGVSVASVGAWRAVAAGGLLGVGALLVAWVLPTYGVHPGVSDLWFRVVEPWFRVQGNVERLFVAVNAPPGAPRGLDFATALAPRAPFELAEQPVLIVEADEPRYWRAVTYDTYTGAGMVNTRPTASRRVEATRETVTEASYQARKPLLQRVRMLETGASAVFAADAPVWVSEPVVAEHRGQTDDLVQVRFAAPLQAGQEYTVLSSVPIASPSELRSAGQDYPEWVRAYLQLPPSLPSRVRLEALRLTEGAATPYDKAVAIEAALRQMPYTTAVPVPPPGRDWVDYLLFEARQGYCDYFATAMTVMLRSVGVPARVASGFAPGEKDPFTGRIVVRESQAHSWVEVFFPGYGWIPFEPSGVRELPPRLDGNQEETAAPLPTAAMPPEPSPSEAIEQVPPIGFPVTGETLVRGLTASWVVPWVVLGALLAVVGLAVAFFVAWRHGLWGLPAELRCYGRLVRLATWCGYGPRPSHTPAEYAVFLGRLAPEVAPYVQRIVAAYAAATYGSRATPSSRRALERAWRACWRPLLRQLLHHRWERALERWNRRPVARQR
ncbi:MAG TPA: transglutaminase domain-containing protein [Chloroflexota bacterium]